GFLAALYRDALGRPIDPVGLAKSSELVARGFSRTTVAALVLQSEESYRRLVENYYRAYLHRGADQKGAAAWVAELGRLVDAGAILAQLLAGDEYYAKLP